MTASSDILTVGGHYAASILQDWREIKTLSMFYREKILSQEANTPESKKILREFIAAMTTMWGELFPKLEDRDDGLVNMSFVDEFREFEKYCYNPSALCEVDNATDIFRLQMVLRKAIEKLRITVYE